MVDDNGNYNYTVGINEDKLIQTIQENDTNTITTAESGHAIITAVSYTHLLRKRSWKKLFRVKSGVTRITGLSGMGAKSARLASRCAVAALL